MLKLYAMASSCNYIEPIVYLQIPYVNVVKLLPSCMC